MFIILSIYCLLIMLSSNFIKLVIIVVYVCNCNAFQHSSFSISKYSTRSNFGKYITKYELSSVSNNAVWFMSNNLNPRRDGYNNQLYLYGIHSILRFNVYHYGNANNSILLCNYFGPRDMYICMINYTSTYVIMIIILTICIISIFKKFYSKSIQTLAIRFGSTYSVGRDYSNKRTLFQPYENDLEMGILQSNFIQNRKKRLFGPSSTNPHLNLLSSNPKFMDTEANDNFNEMVKVCRYDKNGHPVQVFC
jgi:hypothetical protein